MKKKTINKVLLSKFNEWLGSLPEDLQKQVKDKCIITGGCIASMLMKEKVNDYDIYFTDKATTKAIASYYTNLWNKANSDNGYVLDGADKSTEFKGGVALNMTPDRIKIIFKSSGVAKEKGSMSDEEELENWPEEKAKVEEESKPRYRPIFLSCNAITLSQQVQIIIRFYGDPDHIHQHYDYVHCTNYWTSKDKEVILKQNALEALMAKELVYIGSKYPLASVIRTRKFIKRGFTCNAGQYLKMAFQISQLDLTNIEILEDQLTGVDIAYFNSLIYALVDHKEKNPDFTLGYPYLAEIIDRIF